MRYRLTDDNRKINVSVMVSIGQIKQLDAIADDELASRSYILRKAIAFYLANTTHAADTQRSDTALTAAD